ncbi:hypothetical protein C8E00_1059 [Chromohalobacter marismortui]|uniref:Uncharacterized protein n=1 Tax=Chromohalobacter marismortui TaxID=42055 RepID=A0A4R7NL81_9GAMM|nr:MULTISPECIES: hypothetical protein [Chromohalobacter]MCI0510110.1 hypothetical protein [Chromohalobacter sp.]MCI0594821.1 hypothetical protein [Chromohalobacter sp.]TDU21525.1 hypothetical protein C8E00_1059 [Chromohalobacter marismortui]
MSREEFADELDLFDAVNDASYPRLRGGRSDTLKARRRVEELLEERRLQRAIEDDWDIGDVDEEE